MTYSIAADIVGIVGVVFILVSYFFLQIGKIHQTSLGYSLINLVGALLILMSLLVNWNLASVIIEVFWALISIYGIIKWQRQKN